MEAVSGIDYIFADHFKPYRVYANANRFKISHTLLVAVLPIVAACLVAWFCSAFVAANAGPLIAVYAVIAAVLTAIMPTINGLIGPIDRKRIDDLLTGSLTSDDNIKEAETLVAKVEIVRALYAAVAWSVLVLCVSLIPAFALSHSAFIADTKVPPVAIGPALRAVRMVLVGMTAFAGATSLIALWQIVSGVHLLLRHGQVDVEKNVKLLQDRYHL